jgi:hypothetical protein
MQWLIKWHKIYKGHLDLVISELQLTNYMEQSPSWWASSSLASEEIPHNFWDLKFHYRA